MVTAAGQMDSLVADRRTRFCRYFTSSRCTFSLSSLACCLTVENDQRLPPVNPSPIQFPAGRHSSPSLCDLTQRIRSRISQDHSVHSSLRGLNSAFSWPGLYSLSGASTSHPPGRCVATRRPPSRSRAVSWPSHRSVVHYKAESRQPPCCCVSPRRSSGQRSRLSPGKRYSAAIRGANKMHEDADLRVDAQGPLE